MCNLFLFLLKFTKCNQKLKLKLDNMSKKELFDKLYRTNSK